MNEWSIYLCRSSCWGKELGSYQEIQLVYITFLYRSHC